MAWRCFLPDGREVRTTEGACKKNGGTFIDTNPGFRIFGGDTMAIGTMNGTTRFPMVRRLSSPVPIPLPTSGGGVESNLDLGQIGKDIVDIGVDWLRNKVVPTGTTTTFSGPLVPEAKCPEGQFGIPPACFDLVPGGPTQGGGMLITPGEAVLGRYGAALQPSVQDRSVRRCMRGMVLGNDGLCYNRSDLKKSERWWIPARRPLLTGGDLNAISRAARAANKLQTQQKRLQKLGLLSKPASRSRGRSAKMLTSAVPGVVQIQQE